MDQCKTSPLMRLGESDLFKGVIMGVISAPLGIIIDNASKFLMDPSRPFSFNWKVLVASAIVGGGSYLVKNFLTGSNGQFLTNKPPTPEPPGDHPKGSP